MKKIGFLLVIFLIVFKTSYSQFILGKSFSDATKELKTVLLKNGFHFLSQKRIGERPGTEVVVYEMRFKEEFRILLFVNGYENIDDLSIETEKENNYKKLKSIYHDSKWKYIRHDNENGSAEVYSYLNFIIYDYGYSEWFGQPDMYKFAINLDNE